MKAAKILITLILVMLISSSCLFAADSDSASGSRQMMEEIESILYGYVSQGGIVERLEKAEHDLFGRSLIGTMAERHAAILNFINVGTEEQPSMMFKLGVAEWVVDKRIQATESIAKRLENIEINLLGSSRQGNPIAMRIESLLSTLVMDTVSAQPVNLPGDTIMRFRFMDELSPATSKTGDRVRLELTNDLIVNQCLVAPAGSLLLTEVREVKRPRMFGVPGEVRLAFNELKPLGPERPPVIVGEAAQQAIKDAARIGDRGEGAIVGAGAASLAGAVLLGPVGLVSGAFIRGNSIKILAGSLTYVQTSGDIIVSAYPIPVSLQTRAPSITSTMPNETNETQSSVGPSDSDTIIKGNVFNNPPYGTVPSNSGSGTVRNGEDFELPPEQSVN